MPAQLAVRYKNRAQQARVVTEAWGRAELFCANCESASLDGTPPNSRAIDFVCPRCSASFQLKAKCGAVGATMGDGAYTAMLAAIRTDNTPNLLLMRYDWPAWRVEDLILIPNFAFPESAIIKRKPLAATARRAGWVGCNIDLRHIAPEARISVVAGREPVPPTAVRASYQRLKPLREIKAAERGWTLDVLNALRRLGKAEFATTDAYSFARDLEQLHPDNRHVRDKIRQQLQVLRDLGLLVHVERGRWRLP
ncbi:MAG: DpnI domain-containing protein [Chloracidobacterium sp.]